MSKQLLVCVRRYWVAAAVARAGSVVPLFNENVVVTNNMTASSHVDGPSVVNNLGTTTAQQEFWPQRHPRATP